MATHCPQGLFRSHLIFRRRQLMHDNAGRRRFNTRRSMGMKDVVCWSTVQTWEMGGRKSILLGRKKAVGPELGAAPVNSHESIDD